LIPRLQEVSGGMNSTLPLRRCAFRLLGAAVLLTGCLPLAGCGDRSGRFNVSGKVTFDGKPIPAGRIYFDPDGSKGNRGLQGSAEIKDGQYDTARSRKGTTGGPVIVRIEGADGVRTDDDHPNGKPLFPTYETTAELPKEPTTKDFDVPASAAKAKPATKPASTGP